MNNTLSFSKYRKKFYIEYIDAGHVYAGFDDQWLKQYIEETYNVTIMRDDIVFDIDTCPLFVLKFS